jgi:hypothetical protein
MERQLEELRAKMERSIGALAQFERELNVINPEAKTTILSARLLQLNADFTAAQTIRVGKEAALDSVNSGDSHALAATSQGEALKRLTEKLDDVQQKFAETGIVFGRKPPGVSKGRGSNHRTAASDGGLASQFCSARGSRVPGSQGTRAYARGGGGSKQDRIRPRELEVIRVSGRKAGGRG